jgi:mono/diheme cytochrome c family protein
MKRTTAVLFSLTVLTALTKPVTAADAQHGETLAKRWCASCHVVAPDQQRGSTAAPSFSEVANRPEIDAARIALFLLSPHPRMPDMNLTRIEAGDLAAYIESQKK